MSAELRAWSQGNEWQFVKALINSLPSFPHGRDQLHYHPYEWSTGTLQGIS